MPVIVMPMGIMPVFAMRFGRLSASWGKQGDEQGKGQPSGSRA